MNIWASQVVFARGKKPHRMSLLYISSDPSSYKGMVNRNTLNIFHFRDRKSVV